MDTVIIDVVATLFHEEAKDFYVSSRIRHRAFETVVNFRKAFKQYCEESNKPEMDHNSAKYVYYIDSGRSSMRSYIKKRAIVNAHLLLGIPQKSEKNGEAYAQWLQRDDVKRAAGRIRRPRTSGMNGFYDFVAKTYGKRGCYLNSAHQRVYEAFAVLCVFLYLTGKQLLPE